MRSLLLALSLLCLAPAAAHAYDCPQTSATEAWDASTIIFAGKVVAASRKGKDTQGTVTLRVVERFKGQLGKRKTVKVRWHGADPLPAKGTRLLFTGHRDGKGKLVTWPCASLNLTVAEARALRGRP